MVIVLLASCTGRGERETADGMGRSEDRLADEVQSEGGSPTGNGKEVDRSHFLSRRTEETNGGRHQVRIRPNVLQLLRESVDGKKMLASNAKSS